MPHSVKAGIIGAGQITKSHIEGYRKAGAEVIAICDPLQQAREAKAREFGIANVYETAEELIANPDITAVSVCAPNALHAQYTVKALESGKHVMVEKPMAMTVAEAKSMVAAAKKSGKLLMCGHNQRFTPATCQKVNEMREAGDFGHIYHAKCAWIRRRGIPGLGKWFTTKSLSGGGPLIDLGIHVIERTWFMMGRPAPVSVTAATYCALGKDMEKYVYTGMWAGPPDFKGTMDVEDFASAMIRFDNGATLVAEVSWAANRPSEESWSLLMGNKLGAMVDKNGLTLYGEHGKALTTSTLEFDQSGYPNRHAHFIDCITRGTPCKCPGEDGLTMQKVLNAIYKSSEQHAEVKL